MYKIVTLNMCMKEHVDIFYDFDKFIEKLSRLVRTYKTLDVYVNNELVATTEGGKLYQFKKFKKIA